MGLQPGVTPAQAFVELVTWMLCHRGAPIELWLYRVACVAVFAAPIVARVRITCGDAALSATITDVSAGGTKDLVVMDDFVYGEPHPLP